MFKSESVELGIIPIESVISDIPMMRAFESISTSTAGTSEKAWKPFISRNKVGERIKALQQNINVFLLITTMIAFKIKRKVTIQTTVR